MTCSHCNSDRINNVTRICRDCWTTWHETELIGTKVGTVESGPLTGWAKVSTGDGRYVTTKSGVCFGRQHDPTIPTDLAWVAVNAYLIAKARGYQS